MITRLLNMGLRVILYVVKNKDVETDLTSNDLVIWLVEDKILFMGKMVKTGLWEEVVGKTVKKHVIQKETSYKE